MTFTFFGKSFLAHFICLLESNQLSRGEVYETCAQLREDKVEVLLISSTKPVELNVTRNLRVKIQSVPMAKKKCVHQVCTT